MKYLILVTGFNPFLTSWYDYDNHFVKGMVVYNLNNLTYSVDGKEFKEIDNL